MIYSRWPAHKTVKFLIIFLSHIGTALLYSQSVQSGQIIKSTATAITVSAAPTISATVIGPKPVPSTALSKGTVFVSPSGSGTTCSQAQPCDVQYAIEQKAAAGDVVFLRGGIYVLSNDLNMTKSGTSANRITIESFPGEKAIFEGPKVNSRSDYDSTATPHNRLCIVGNYWVMRNIEIRNQPLTGLMIYGSDNLIEGVVTHHNALSGIEIYQNGSRNIIRHTIAHNNSDAGLYNTTSFSYNNGNNGDGLTMTNGDSNRFENCLAYENSDDGMDTWISTNAYIGYSISHSNGAANGNGSGFKPGGDNTDAHTLIEHSIAYSNRSTGFNVNGGINSTLRYNTAWKNGYYGFITMPSSRVEKNIAVENTPAQFVGSNGSLSGAGTLTDNSLQRSGTVTFISTDPASKDFLRPNTGFTDIGAYGGL